MAFEITEAQVQRMLQEGIQSAINSMLRDSYGQGAKLKKALYNILRIKAIDGTAEHIGNGKFIYVLTDEDYCRIVLGIEKEIEHATD